MYFNILSTLTRNQLGKLALSAAAMCFAANTYASEEHSDVEYLFTGGAIEIEFADPSFVVFEGDFNLPEIQQQPNGFTDDPGFDNEEFIGSGNMPDQGSYLGFDVVGPLKYWNGTTFADPGSAFITISSDLLGLTYGDISGSTISDIANFAMGNLNNVIGQADANGVIHEHVDFNLFNGMTGAYGLEFVLTTNQSGIADSRKFGFFFNNFLDFEEFEAGVDAFNAHVVPVPAAVWLFATALGFLLPRVSQRKA